MKKLISVLALVTFLFNSFNLYSQGIDKPIYQVVTHRAGIYLGTFKLELYPLIAPNHTHNFDSLALALAFDSTAFHRVVPGFVIQGGDPNSINGPKSTWGQGNPNQPTVNAEFSVVRHLRGIIGAARDNNINSASSQFYICVAPATFLDGQYTVFGKVTTGMNVVDTIVNAPRDVNDVPFQKIEMFVTYLGVNDTIPGVPALLSPANNLTNVGNTQNFQWTNINGAVLYTTEFSVDSTFSIINYSRNSGLNSTSIPNVLGNTKYYWRVKANNGGHESSYSSIRAFTTKAAPVLLLPTNLDTGIVLSPTCKWTAVPGATSYLLQIAINTSFNSASLAYFQAGILDTTKQASGLLPNTTYYWRVRGNTGATQGLASQVYSFTTGVSVGINKQNSETNKLNIKNLYPNPAKNELLISLAFSKTEKATFSIVDLTGKTILSELKTISLGTADYKLNVSKISKGIYFLNIETTDGIVSKKIEIE